MISYPKKCSNKPAIIKLGTCHDTLIYLFDFFSFFDYKETEQKVSWPFSRKFSFIILLPFLDLFYFSCKDASYLLFWFIVGYLKGWKLSFHGKLYNWGKNLWIDEVQAIENHSFLMKTRIYTKFIGNFLFKRLKYLYHH